MSDPVRTHRVAIWQEFLAKNKSMIKRQGRSAVIKSKLGSGSDVADSLGGPGFATIASQKIVKEKPGPVREQPTEVRIQEKDWTVNHVISQRNLGPCLPCVGSVMQGRS